MARFFLVFIIVFSVGVFTASFISLSYFFGLFFIFLGLAFFVIQKRFFVFVLILLSFGAGIFWYEFRSLPIDTSFLDSHVNTKISLQGIVVDEPDERENYTRFVLEMDLTGSPQVKILITAYYYPSFQYGDKVEVNGVIKKPKKFSEFDWPAYLAKDDILFEMFYPEMKFVSADNASWIRQQLFAFKEKILFNISKVIPEPHSALLSGLTFGAKRAMPQNCWRIFVEQELFTLLCFLDTT